MNYERVTIQGGYYYKVPLDDVERDTMEVCRGCHFHDPQEHCLFPLDTLSISCIDDPDEPMYVFMTEGELAKENIRKRKEKQRNTKN